MPIEPSVTSAVVGLWSCTFRYPSALLPKIFERPGPKSVSAATNSSGVEVVFSLKWIVDMAYSVLWVVTRRVCKRGYGSRPGIMIFRTAAAPVAVPCVTVVDAGCGRGGG